MNSNPQTGAPPSPQADLHQQDHHQIFGVGEGKLPVKIYKVNSSEIQVKN